MRRATKEGVAAGIGIEAMGQIDKVEKGIRYND